ncbi:MAG: hypothetical protein KIT65_10975 [Xanthobacteraceae bacterium]|nr:hypothetical protein [Xanthobacteraceae bacterium]
MSPAHLLALYLAQNGVGTFGGSAKWSISVSREPVDPPEAVTIYDTGGDGPDTDELDLLGPTIQVRVRGPNYAEAYAKQEEIRDLLILDQPVIVTPEGATVPAEFIGIVMQSDILAIGRDENDRHLLTANYSATKVRNAAEGAI